MCFMSSQMNTGIVFRVLKGEVSPDSSKSLFRVKKIAVLSAQQWVGSQRGEREANLGELMMLLGPSQLTFYW